MNEFRKGFEGADNILVFTTSMDKLGNEGFSKLDEIVWKYFKVKTVIYSEGFMQEVKEIDPEIKKVEGVLILIDTPQ